MHGFLSSSGEKKQKTSAADKLSSYELSTVQPPLLVPVIFEIRYLLWDLMSWWKRWDGGNCVHRRITKQALDLLHLYQKGNAKCWNQANMEGYTEENASNWMWEMGVIWQSHALNETEWVCVCLLLKTNTQRDTLFYTGIAACAHTVIHTHSHKTPTLKHLRASLRCL